MGRFLLLLPLYLDLVAVVFPLVGQSPPGPKFNSVTSVAQRALDERLMTTLTRGQRGHGDIARVRGLLEQGASPNAKNWDGNTRTALIVAIQKGYADIAKLLLDHGADVNAKAEYVRGAEGHVLTGITALSMASQSGNLALVKMLVERGAHIHALDGQGASVLAYATTNHVVQFYLDCNLDINARDNDGYTLLIHSAEGFHRPSIAFLLQHGADPNAKTTDGTTALKLAQGAGRSADVELLKKAGAKE